MEDGEGEGQFESFARHERIWGSRGTASFILNLSTSWGDQSVSGFGRLPPGKEPPVPNE